LEEVAEAVEAMVLVLLEMQLELQEAAVADKELEVLALEVLVIMEALLLEQINKEAQVVEAAAQQVEDLLCKAVDTVEEMAEAVY
jgi:hypothetical protein